MTVCDEGNFGRGCALTCGLCREGSCNPVNGTCMGGCAAGYDGALCANCKLLNLNVSIETVMIYRDIFMPSVNKVGGI